MIYIIWGADFHFYTSGLRKMVFLPFGIKLKIDEIFIVLVAWAAVAVVYLFLTRTKAGKAMARVGHRSVCRAPSHRGAKRRLARGRDATRARTSTSYAGVASGDGRRGKETRGLGYVTITTQETDTVCGPKAVAEGRADEPDGGKAHDSHLVQGLDDIPAHDRPYDCCARWSAARADLYHRRYGRSQARRVCSHSYFSWAHSQREKEPNTVSGARG